MSRFRERIILANDDDADDDGGEDFFGRNNLNFGDNITEERERENDLYKGYNEFHPALDIRNLQNDDEFSETLNKSRLGRVSAYGNRSRLIGSTNSTAATAFTRSNHGLKSRRTALSRGTGAMRSALGTGATNRPATAIRGAGYTSQNAQNRLFDPLGLAERGNLSTSSTFHLQDESTPEWKIKQLEKQIMLLLDESVAMAVNHGDFSQSLDLAKDCVAKERSLNRLKENSGLMETFGPNHDLTFATMFNLAERYSDAKMWSESINIYQAILKNRSFINQGRLRINIGEIYFRQQQYPKAIKFFRMALDQISTTQNELRWKLMKNIGLAFVRLQQYLDAITTFEFILSERSDWDDPETIFHLILCYYALNDCDKMKYCFNKLLQVRVEDQFEDRYGHHEILTNGGTVFSGFTSEGLQKNSNGSDRIGQSNRSASPVLLIRDEQDHYNNLLLDAIRNDKLRQFEKAYINHVEWCILTSAKLISPTIETENGNTNRANPQVELMRTKNSDEKLASSISGYDWCLEQLNRMALQSSATSFGFNSGLNFVHLADELELYKAAKHLRSRGFDEAMETFKSFERKDRMMVSKNNASGSSTLGNRQGSTTPGSNRTSSASARIISTAATNLSFLYLLQKKFDLAEKYADEAIAMDRYCIGAILNKGNLYYIQNDYQSATEFYHEVIANNSTVFEAYFNLALAERNLGNYDKALDALYRLQTIIRVSSGEQQNHTINQKIINSIQVELLYQIGSIYDSMGNQDQAKDYFQKVLNLVPTDIELLVKLADIALIENNRKQALNYLQEAHRYFPSHIPTIERLASYYIEMKMYNQTIKHLQQLADIQPNEIRWQLMIAASYRRAGNHSQSLATYENIHQRFPENLDCLKFLLRLCSELNARDAHSYDNLIEKYSIILKRLEKTKELREEQKLTSSRSTTAAGRNSKNSFQSSREGSAATTNSSTNSSASGSSGYMTSFTNTGLKSITPTKTSLTNSLHSHNESQSNISAIVDEVVEQLDSNLKRPLTSWRRGDKINSNNENQFDEDFLIDTNLDEMLPD